MTLYQQIPNSNGIGPQPGGGFDWTAPSGRTTLARQLVAPDSLNYFDLEDLTSLARVEEPMIALRDLYGLVVIDEILRRPELFPVLRVLCNRDLP